MIDNLFQADDRYQMYDPHMFGSGIELDPHGTLGVFSFPVSSDLFMENNECASLSEAIFRSLCESPETDLSQMAPYATYLGAHWAVTSANSDPAMDTWMFVWFSQEYSGFPEYNTQKIVYTEANHPVEASLVDIEYVKDGLSYVTGNTSDMFRKLTTQMFRDVSGHNALWTAASDYLNGKGNPHTFLHKIAPQRNYSQKWWDTACVQCSLDELAATAQTADSLADLAVSTMRRAAPNSGDVVLWDMVAVLAENKKTRAQDNSLICQANAVLGR